MSAGIFRVHWRRIDRLPSRIALGGGVTVDVSIAYRGDWPPEFVLILGIKKCNASIGFRHRGQRHEMRTVDRVHILGNDNLPYQLVRHAGIDRNPEARVFGLSCATLGAVLLPELFDFI